MKERYTLENPAALLDNLETIREILDEHEHQVAQAIPTNVADVIKEQAIAELLAVCEENIENISTSLESARDTFPDDPSFCCFTKQVDQLKRLLAIQALDLEHFGHFWNQYDWTRVKPEDMAAPNVYRIRREGYGEGPEKTVKTESVTHVIGGLIQIEGHWNNEAFKRSEFIDHNVNVWVRS